MGGGRERREKKCTEVSPSTPSPQLLLKFHQAPEPFLPQLGSECARLFGEFKHFAKSPSPGCVALLSGREAFQIILIFLRKDSGGIQLEAIKKEQNKSADLESNILEVNKMIY